MPVNALECKAKRMRFFMSPISGERAPENLLLDNTRPFLSFVKSPISVGSVPPVKVLKDKNRDLSRAQSPVLEIQKVEIPKGTKL